MSKEKQNLCNSCKHEKICKFKKDFIIAEDGFYNEEVELNKNFKEENLIKISVNCKFYSPLESIFITKTIDIPKDTFESPWPITDPCENCAWHKSMLTRTSPYIGDTPCEFCSANKWRLTCLDKSTASTSLESNSIEKEPCELNQ